MAREQSSIRFHNRLKLAIACCLVAFAVINPEPYWNKGVHAMPPLTAEMEVLREDQFTAASLDERPLNSTRFVDNGDSNSTQKSGVDGSAPRASDGLQLSDKELRDDSAAPPSAVILHAAVSPPTGKDDGGRRFLNVYYRYLDAGGGNSAGDWIGVFDRDPLQLPNAPQSGNSSRHLLAKISVPSSSGTAEEELPLCPDDGRRTSSQRLRLISTEIPIPESLDPDRISWPPRSKCLGLWVGYFRAARDGELVAVDCLKIQPAWMRSMRRVLANVTLADLLVPGTVVSGASPANFEPKSKVIWSSDRGSDNQHNKEEGKRFTHGDLPQLPVVHQDSSIRSQLVLGIRYLEFNVAFSPPESAPTFGTQNRSLHFVSTNELGQDFGPVLAQLAEVKRFLNESEEILVVNLKSFEKFDRQPDTHDEFVKSVRAQLGAWMAPRDFGPTFTLSLLWKTNKRLIVQYADEETRTRNVFLWEPPTRGGAAGTNDEECDSGQEARMKNLCELNKKLRIERLTAERSLHDADADAARSRAGKTNACFAQRLLLSRSNDHQEGATTGRTYNIVAVDFVRSSFLVDAAIQANFRKAKLRASQKEHREWLEEEALPRESRITSAAKTNLWHSSKVDGQHLKPILIGPRRID